MSGSNEQVLALQRLMQLLPAVNRDTLFVLLHFLGLVAENADDKTAPDGTSCNRLTRRMVFHKYSSKIFIRAMKDLQQN